MKLTPEAKKVLTFTGTFLIFGVVGGLIVDRVRKKGTNKNKMAISEKAYQDAARKLNVDTAAIKAVAKIEGGSKAFYPETDFPIVRMENHILRRYCSKNGLTCPDFGSNSYGIGEWNRFKKAYEWNKDAAIYSTSFGLFQIMGFNYKSCGYNSLQSFYNAMSQSADKQFDAFVNFIQKNNLAQYIQSKNWAGFAYRYNGPAYAQNAYDVKLANAYASFLKQG